MKSPLVFTLSLILLFLSSTPPAWAQSCEQEFAPIHGALMGGGPPQDGIPALEQPEYAHADEIVLPEETLVFGVDYNGLVAAYPENIMVWHEIVNETTGDELVSITYCPLTRTVIGYRGYNLGTSGQLYNSNLVMYDRGTDALIPQILGTAIDTDLCGVSPDTFPVTVTTWGEWRAAHPNTLVLTTNTGHVRDYSRDPYATYHAVDDVMFPLSDASDTLPNKTVVFGVRHNGEAVAVVKQDFFQRYPDGLSVNVGGLDVTLVWNPDMGVIDVDQDVLAFEGYWFAWYAFHPFLELLP